MFAVADLGGICHTLREQVAAPLEIRYPCVCALVIDAR
jgi:hypothetical protein